MDTHKYSHAGAFDMNAGLEEKQGILMISSTPEGHSSVWAAGGVCNSLQAGARRKDGISKLKTQRGEEQLQGEGN